MVDRSHAIKLRDIYTVLVTLLLIGVLVIAFVPSFFEAIFPDHSPVLTVTADSDAGLTEFTAEQLGKDCTFRVAYYNVSDITVTFGKKSYPMADAIRDGLLTIEQIIAQAQSDCRDQNICREKYSSDLGCATFIYQYSDYDIVYRYDVFELSDGMTHLFKDVVFTPSGQGESLNLNFGVEYPGDLLYEDWGLSFEVEESTSAHAQFAVRQSNGQHVDKLILNGYWLNDSDGNAVIPHQRLENETELINNDTTTVVLDWSQVFGALEPGTYKLFLSISERYEMDAVHPLQKNYRDGQTYFVEFTIS